MAALGVCLFHYICKTPGLIEDGWITKIFSFGHYGVQVFFIISGFIILYSLSNHNYKTKDYFRFILKRLIRLEPPYLISLLGMVAYLIVREYLPSFNGLSLIPDWNQFLLHLGYLIPYQNFYNWISPVYWTLGIEFQFYLIMGLLFVPFRQYYKISIILLSIIAVLPIQSHQFFITDHLKFFIAGMFLFLLHENPKDYFIILGMVVVGFALKNHVFVLSVFILMTIGVMWFSQFSNKFFDFFAKISYSLYLMHPFIGQPIINLGIKKTTGDVQNFLLVTTATLVTIGISYGVYWLVELPAVRWSKKVKLNKG
jgi:peptidoglycan/LPS O-acetylase OafA/YrhL